MFEALVDKTSKVIKTLQFVVQQKKNHDVSIEYRLKVGVFLTFKIKLANRSNYEK